MTREEIIDFCDMKAILEPENEDIFKAIIKALEQKLMFECEGKTYIGENLVLKTIDKDNICSFYGFREVEE